MAQTLLDEHLQKYPHLGADIQTIKLQFQERLWHQLADELIKYTKA